jgi:hypothetical protein
MCLLGLAIHPSSDAAFFWTPYTTSCEAFVSGKEKETVTAKMTTESFRFDLETANLSQL